MDFDIDLPGALRRIFGFDSFRPGQERVIRNLLAGHDTLAILPTGAGKSLLYQLTSQLLPGVTLVVSPLLALMKDQAEQLAAHGLQVGVVNSAQSASEAREAIEAAQANDTRLLYVTPERLESPEFLADAGRMAISLLVIDEAHSISEWGQSFRPAYLNLPTSIKALGRPTLLALTATATPWVRQDIIERLELRAPRVVVHGTQRANLYLEVRRVENESEDRRVLRELLVESSQATLPDAEAAEGGLADVMHGSGIIYVSTTRAAQETSGWLNEWGIQADYYHGQRKKSDRARVQDAFMSGEVRVIVATNAFGMGIDKPDVRFVIHRDVPASLERYYQEAGRAGRDGELSRCVLIYRPGDLGRAAFLAGGGELTRDEVIRAHAGLATLHGASATLTELQARTGLGRADLVRLLDLLEEAGVARWRLRRVRLVDDFDPESLPLEREAARRAYERSRLDMMRGYAELRDCRWRYVLNYFGEEPEWERCDRCDVDTARLEPAEPASTRADNQPFAINERVVHASLGEGLVQRVTADSITVLFEEAGYKTLDTALVLEQHLVQRA